MECAASGGALDEARGPVKKHGPKRTGADLRRGGGLASKKTARLYVKRLQSNC